MNRGLREFAAARCFVAPSAALPQHMRALVREVSKVHVPQEARRMGYASALLHKVCAEADAAGITLLIQVQPFGDDIELGRTQLSEWYARRFGFIGIQAEPLLMARMPGATPRLTLKPLAQAAATH